jgi:spore coat protein CotH
MNLTFRRYYPILLLVIAVLGVLVFILGEQRVIAYTTQSASIENVDAFTGTNFANSSDLFDDSIVHTIEVIMDENEYDNMLVTFQETGLKEYFKVDVVIDGVRINEVGIRLKGNASLRSAFGGGGMGQPNFGQEGNLGELPQRPEVGDVPEFGERPQLPENFDPTDEIPEGLENHQFPPMMGEQGDLPEGFNFPEGGGFQRNNLSMLNSGEVKIPFMIKFDEYISGQTYQGYTAIALRTYGTSYDEAILQEPLTNQVANLVGLPATKIAYTGFTINGEDEKLYVVSELVNEVFLEGNFENGNGILYKAEFGSTLNYKGEDPSSYADSFNQQTRKNEADLLPLISFMRFLEQADDQTFENELHNWLDFDSFALYLAVNAIVVNTDSMIGMNNNFYLYFDDLSEKFTVIMWDTNESFGKLGGSVNYDISLSDVPSGFQGGRGGRGGAMGGGQNVLISRFLDNENFRELYYEQLEFVYEQVFKSDFLEESISHYSSLINSINDERNLVDLDEYNQDVEDLLEFISQRRDYLAQLPLFTLD